jgi:Ca2+-binding RTX toxin-like protein
MTKFEAFESFTVYSRESAAIVARNVRALTSDPLASIPFFRTDDNRYRAQVSVNHDIWIDLPLPAGGRFADHIGDPLTELPSLGNGLYRVRVWIDGAEGATTPVISRVVEVTDNGFDYRGGQRAPDGGDGADQIAGLATADLIRARGGNDTVDAGDGDDTVDGGEGSDRLTGGRGSDCLIGGGGSDILDGGTQSDRLDGGVGADLLVGGEGDDTLLGGDGNDTLRPGPGSNVMDGGAGFDSIDLSDMPASAGGFLIDIGARFFRPIAGGASQAFAGMEWAVGSAAADRIIGTGNGERITGGRGDDTLEGGFGRDVYIFDPAAGFGADVVVNFQSDDELWFDRFVDPGMDDLIFLDPAGAMWVPGMGGSIDLARPNGFVAYAGVNAEGFHVYRLVFIARPAFDIPATTPIHEDPALIRGGAGSDALVGGSGPDRIDGLGGGDVLRGLGGADALFGGDGADTLDGGDGPDWLLGGSGDDLLRGGVGSDTIEGGDGDDRVIWSDFVDRIAGGNGLDTLDFSEMRAGGVFVDLQTQTVSSLGGLTVSQATFSGIERVTGTASADHLRGLSGADRLTGGLGDDTLDGDTGSDVYIFDNRTFFGRDEVRNFQSNDQFWFADFLDPGADGVIFLDSAGRLSVPTPGGRIATIDTIHDNRMVRYQGVNAEGSHVYVIDYNTRPSRDLLGAYAPSDPGASGVLTVRAAGEAGPGEGPKFLVRIGGVQIGAIEIDPAQSPLSIQQNGLAYRDYSFTHDPTLVGERIDIVFFNDGRDPVTGDDRNLYVDRVVANGRILEAETDGNFTPMWAGGSATPGPREALYWDGTLTF